MADETDAQRFFGGHLPGGEQQLHGEGVRDLPAQPHRRTTERKQPPLGFEDAEDGALPRHPDIRGLQDLGPSGDGPALHRRDQRLAQVVVAQERLPVQVRVLCHAGLVPLGVTAAHGLEVHAGTEGPAGAGEDGAANFVVAVDLLPRILHADQHRQAQGVLRLRSVHGDDGGGALAFERQVLSGYHGPLQR